MAVESNETQVSMLEKKMIKEAYEATLDPTRLANFEKYWGEYIDARIAGSGDEGIIEDTGVNANIEIALDILERIRHVNETEETAQTLVDSHYGFGFIIDYKGGILVSNTGADKFVAGQKTLQNLDLDNLSKKRLSDWIKDLREGITQPYKFFEVCIGSDDRLHSWFVCPIKVNSDNINNEPNYFLITATEEFVSIGDADIIGKSLGLTAAETDVARLLCWGLSPKKVAESRGVKITAVRSQISKIKLKMNSKDIPAIVVKFVSMAIRKSAVKSQISRFEQIRLARLGPRDLSDEHIIFLKDGRQYQYYTCGHPKGRVIFNIHSLINSVEMPPYVGRNLVMSGYKLISPVRSGYGKSDLKVYKNISDRVDGCVSDFIELLDHLYIDRYSIFTTWAGPFAQRLALSDSARAKAIFLSGAVPIWDKTHFDYIDPRYSNLIKASMHMPKVLPYMIRLAKALIDSGRAGQHFDALHEMNDSDRMALENKEISGIVARRFTFWVEQGIQAFVSDVPSIHSNWEEDAARLQVPVTVLMGSEIKDQPPESIDRYVELVPNARVVEIPGAGTYQELSHFSEILFEISQSP